MPPMSIPERKMTILKTTVRVRHGLKSLFADWQGKLNAKVAGFKGFISLEILSPTGDASNDYVVINRFDSQDNLLAWRESKEYQALIDELRSLVDEPDSIIEKKIAASDLMQEGVTEVFITEVNPDKDIFFREWIAKIHQTEAKFPGFKGVYVQSPVGQGKNWITLLQFDRLENLDRWLTSPEREQILKESKPLITSLENHRVISPYSGWFSSFAKKGELPPLWKQTMLILLVLFPMVMLELKFLNPLTQALGLSLSTFIGNAISVTLISWPMMPIAIFCLSWWLTPGGNKRSKLIAGILILIVLYLLEIAIFWNF